ncbi:heme lyase CcmF/NrfE family subunit [Parvularcula flava]|uniref:C-type cytochrome biogenesis protein CcmF n=1 Tax=Aquisalinus luteolus TaxID=1566827 RepID=A0A8J3A5E3_9PROT|nr:heme lyase CcmF/NrfE family subunit [Aquisalinus luteolus]NHK29120.1 heme lyase CcmF/NrfE family subunit [Aquisalinus luteolus]GGI00245.1 c-type cytochrome biogenesis protein CcmF [Aquisalinus luteolus]
MIAEIGHLALILALLVAILQTVVPLWAAHVGDGRGMAIAAPAAIVQFVLILIAFLALMHAYVTSDFSLLNVYQNSHTAKPMLYKIAGVWGNHEGSMVLWLLMLSFFGALVGVLGATLPPSLKARVLGIQALIGVGFLAFSLFTSNPFERIFPVPLNGTDLNPLLQDPGLAYHPPFLYLGYVGFSIAFSFAIAALLEGRVDPAWARWVRPWTLLAWAGLTLGIAMGSWWAYYELGWGGYWFWDPVENASLMPWLAGTALLHCAIVVEKRDTLKLWTILMAITAFSTSLLGTFIVRSGVLTSVHSFASDPGRGVLLLGLCGILTGGALILFALRGAAMKPGGTFSVVSRESALILNNLVLSVLLFTVLIGTFWPTIAETITGERVSVGPPYFNLISIPLMLLLSVFLSFGVLLPWKRGNLKAAAMGLKWAIGLTLLVAIASLIASGFRNVLAAVALVISLMIIFGTLTDIAFRSKMFRVGAPETLRRLRGFTRAYWGGSLAHLGLGVAILGMVGTSIWVNETMQVMEPGDEVEVGGYAVRFNGVTERNVSNYRTEMASVSLLKNGREVAELSPERRWYPVARQMTTEAAIHPRWFDDVYVAIGEPRGEGGQARIVRAYHHPLVFYLWGGAVLMVLGGIVSLSDRRLRVGAPRPSRRPTPATSVSPAQNPTPAE